MTKLHVSLFAAAGLALCSMSVHAEVLDLNLNDDAVRGQFSGPLAHMFPGAQGEYQIGGLYSDDHHDKLSTVNAGFVLSGDAGAEDVRFTAGVGLRGQYTHMQGFDGEGAALGGQFDLRFAGFDRLGLLGYLWYQPKVLSFGDSDGQLEWALDADYQILRNASIYVGYRQVRVNPDHGSWFTPDDGAHLGMRFIF